MEAFSDGVFAFAMTLLVLGLRDPHNRFDWTAAPGPLRRMASLPRFWNKLHHDSCYVDEPPQPVHIHQPYRRTLHASQRTTTLGHDTDSVYNIPCSGPHHIDGLGHSRRSLLWNIPPSGFGLESALAICNQTSQSAGQQC